MAYIYLAGPYTGNEEENYQTHMQVAYQLLQEGHIVFTPIVHFHELAKQFNLPKTFAFWKKQNIAFLRMATEVRVIKIPGWRSSKGTQAELNLASRLGLPISYIEPPEKS